MGIRIYPGAQSGEQLASIFRPVRDPEIKPMCGVTTPKNGPVGPTHPPVTTAVDLRQPLVTRQTHPYRGLFMYSDRGRRIRSKYVFFSYARVLRALRRDEKLSARGNFFFEKLHIDL
jgi:hypothetical protein